MESVVINISGYEVIISACDCERIMAKKWHWRSSEKDGSYFTHGYWKDGKSTQLRLHRFIMDCPEGMCVDHINRNTLDNRRDNLRICSKQDNTRNSSKSKINTSGFKGVSWHSRDKKWRAEVKVNNKKIQKNWNVSVW
jgi:hypothetical protein